MKNIKKRIINNWVSTLIGCLLLVFAGGLTYLEKIPFAGFVGFVPFCIGLIYAKDTDFWVSQKKSDLDNSSNISS
jgi:cadmium resistance protein CadD (predicted permease)